MSDGKDDDSGAKPKRKAKAPSPYANGSYEVGKGKPPKSGQFKKGGQGGPGRRKGSRNRDYFSELLQEKVMIGVDRAGRPIWKAWEEVVDRTLLQVAASKDMGAIRLVKEFKFKMAELDRRYGVPAISVEEMVKKAEEQAESKRLTAQLSARFTALLGFAAELKRYDLVEFVDGIPRLKPDLLARLAPLPKVDQGNQDEDETAAA